MSTIAIDFDGVIHAYSKGWHDGTIYDEPIPGALNALRKLSRHLAVFIFTSRDPKQVADWLEGYGFVTQLDYGTTFWNTFDVLLVSNRKLPAIAYIDDRGIRFESWSQTLTDVERLLK